MKIAYLIGEDLEGHPGLKQKILGQIESWRSLGHEVIPVYHAINHHESDGGAKSEFRGLRIPGARHFEIFQRLARQYRSAFSQLHSIQPDLVYTRYLFPAPGVRKLLTFAKTTVVEINSDDKSEYLGRGRLTGIYNAFARRFSLGCADGFVFVSGELAVSHSFSFLDKPHIILANGIDPSVIPFVRETSNKVPNLVFVGSPSQSWHGVDKIRQMAMRRRDVVFHIVGPSVDECARFFGRDLKNVVSHGYLDSESLSDLLCGMDFGIGTLALHRNKMNEACPLKVRQYLAHGLPVIAGYTDTDIGDGASFFLNLGNYEKNVEEGMDSIGDFIDSGFQNAELRLKARAFAEEHLANRNKELDRLKFLESFVGS
ncbi:glycosyltransferase family 4 protein [Marinobacter halotolerans]|uniref:glycosyltransferase family 4 protein n=1 Tax=Marinobacter halotolerans TaxID=1569211 RepID=UPI0012449A25|nr:glycosyltransferase family 4 protein [Marinobacter halotolerans]